MPVLDILIVTVASAALLLGLLVILRRLPLIVRIAVFLGYCAVVLWVSLLAERHLGILMGHVALGIVLGALVALVITRLRWRTRILSAPALPPGDRSQ